MASSSQKLKDISTIHSPSDTTCPPHGHVLTLLGQEFRIHRDTLPGNKIAELDADAHTITIDAPDSEFLHQLCHELTEYTLEELGCHFGNFDGEHRYILTHTQMDNTVKVVLAAVRTLREVK